LASHRACCWRIPGTDYQIALVYQPFGHERHDWQLLGRRSCYVPTVFEFSIRLTRLII